MTDYKTQKIYDSNAHKELSFDAPVGEVLHLEAIIAVREIRAIAASSNQYACVFRIVCDCELPASWNCTNSLIAIRLVERPQPRNARKHPEKNRGSGRRDSTKVSETEADAR